MKFPLLLIASLVFVFSCKKEGPTPETPSVEPDYAMQIQGKYYDAESYAEVTRVSKMQVSMVVDYFGVSFVSYDTMSLSLHGDTIFIVEPNPDINTVFVIGDTLMIESIKDMKLIKSKGSF